MAGFAAGTFGSATGAGGPPVVMYGVERVPVARFARLGAVALMVVGASLLIVTMV